MLEDEFKYNINYYREDKSKNFYEHIYFFKYEKTIRSLILKYKFQEKPYIYKIIINFLINNVKYLEYFKKYDIILPVPISKKRYFERGYNQSKLLAKELGQYLKIKVSTHNLYKVKNNNPQSTMNKEQRQLNVINMYKVKNIKFLENKKMLIFDDIYTTGNTVNECAKVLVEKGIKKENIGIVTIAKD